ncbi:MAG: hypothetical protein HKM87_02295 [Ignavibacteriaceae bacterium]|nr:hypothetical protein [Ignavibacteriaceae bacterium]
MSNKLNPLLAAFLLALSTLTFLHAQDTDSIEVYLIDSYVKPELPHTFYLSYFTSDLCKSKVIIDDNYEYTVSDELSDIHNFEIEITDLEFNSKIVNFVIVYEDEAGNKYMGETFDFDLPYEPEIKEGSDFLQVCLFAGAIFLLPYPNVVFQSGENFFSLTKEIPLVSFRSKSRRYPAGYLSLEYSYIFDADTKNYLRAGYKQFYELPHIEYFSPGVSLYTNFLGNNGIGLETSIGLFTIVDTFTLYTRYRYNIKPGGSPGNFHEVSIGLYSSFFSFYLN